MHAYRLLVDVQGTSIPDRPCCEFRGHEGGVKCVGFVGSGADMLVSGSRYVAYKCINVYVLLCI